MSPRRPPPFLLPLEFPPDTAAPASPQEAQTHRPGENRHAVQDDRAGADPGAAGAVRATQEQQAAAAGAGRLRDRAEGQPRPVEAPPRPGETGQRSEPDRGRSPRNGDRAATGPFALRIAEGRGGAYAPERGNG